MGSDPQGLTLAFSDLSMGSDPAGLTPVREALRRPFQSSGLVAGYWGGSIGACRWAFARRDRVSGPASPGKGYGAVKASRSAIFPG